MTDPTAPVPAPSTDALRVAVDALRDGHLGLAEQLLLPVAVSPQSSEPLTLLARVYTEQGRLDDGLATLRTAEKHFADDPLVWKALAAVLKMLGRSSEELVYRRKLAYLFGSAPSSAYLRLAQASAAVCSRDADAGRGDLLFAAKKLASLPVHNESDRRERLALAESLYLVEDLKDKAYAEYTKIEPPRVDERDSFVKWVRLDRWCQHAGTPFVRSATLGETGRRPMLAELQRAAVLPALQWSPVLDESGAGIDGFLMHAIKFRSQESASPLLLHRAAGRSVLRLPRELPVRPGPALLVGGMPQYYHQTVEFLGTLAVAETLGVPEGVPLLLNHDLAPFQRQQFEALGIDETRMIRVAPSEPVRFERLWVATRPVLGGQWVDPLVPAWYRRRLQLSDERGRRKIYVSRAGTDRRRVVNESELAAMLVARGFEVVRPETLSFRDQVALFSEASVIVGATGAALTNMIFAAPRAKVFSLYLQAFAETGAARYFDALAAACGHEFKLLPSRGSRSHPSARPVDADIEADLGAVEAAIG